MVAALIELCFGAPFVDDDASASGRRPRRAVSAHADADTAVDHAHDTLSDLDRALVERLARADVTAFDTLVDRYYDRVTRFAYGFIGHRDVAEDIAQDIFLRVWTLGPDWSPKGSIAAYLFRAARNRALNVLERQQARDRATPMLRDDEFAVPADGALIAAERVAALRAAIATLPERRRTALRLRYEEGMTCAAIGAVLSMSTKSAEQLIALSIRALRKELKTFG